MLMRSPLAGNRLSPPGFIRPCQPTLSTKVPMGPEWTHEIKYDGYRLIARKDGSRVRLWSRTGRSWTDGFSAIATAVREAVDGVPQRHRRNAHRVVQRAGGDRRTRGSRHRPGSH